MRGRHRFVPGAFGTALEDRTLLNALGPADANFWNSNRPTGFISNTGADSDDRRPAHPRPILGRPTTGQLLVQRMQQFHKDFSNLYASLVQTDLFQGGAASLATNRPGFDSQVAVGLVAIENNMAGVLSTSPQAALSLTTAVHEILTGTASTSLLNELIAVPTPTDVDGPSATAFTASSNALINRAFQQVVTDVRRFVHNPMMNFLPGANVIA